MNITVEYTGQLAAAAGASQESLELEPGATLGTAINALAERHDEKFSELILDDGGALRPTLLVAVNGEQAAGDRDNFTIPDAATLMLMTPIAGG